MLLTAALLLAQNPPFLATEEVVGTWLLHGRVQREDAPEVGVEGAELQIDLLGAVHATAVTDATGAFQMEVTGPTAPITGAWALHVVPKPGQRVKIARRVIMDLAKNQTKEFVFQARDVETAPLAGRFVDADGGPLPFYRVYLGESQGPGEVVVCDAEGRFECANEFALGKVFVQRAENTRKRFDTINARLAGQRFIEHDGKGDAEFSIEVGPRFQFDVDLPGGLEADDFVAVLLPADRESKSYELRTGPGATVRPGERPWARFTKLNELEVQVLGEAPWILWLHSRKHGFSSETMLTAEMLADASPFGAKVPVEFKTDGTLVVEVRDRRLMGSRSTGPLHRNEVDVRIRPVESGELDPELQARLDHKVRLWPGPRGTAELILENLAVGKWTVSVEGPLYRTASETVDVPTGRPGRITMDLLPPEDRMSIVVTLTSASGERPFENIARLEVTSKDNPKHRFVVGGLERIPDLRSERDPGGYSGPVLHVSKVLMDGAIFEFKDIPREHYEVRAVPKRFAVHPGSDLLPTANSRVKLRLLDAAGPGVSFNVVDASGAPVDEFQVWAVGPRRYRRFGATTTGGLPVFPDLPKDGLRWCVTSKGSVRVYGDESAFQSTEDGSWVADVKLDAGWSTKVTVVGPDGKRVTGAEILADGQPVAKTVNGKAELRMPARPQRIEVRHGELKAAGGGVKPDGSFSDKGYELFVRLQ